MSKETWMQIRRTGMMVWALGVATYLVVFEGADVGSAMGLVSAGIAALGTRFVE